MRTLLVALALLSAACQTYQPREGQENPRPELLEPQNRVAILGGQRSFDSDFEPVDDQLALGVELHMEPVDSPVGFEVGLGFSGDDATEAGIDVDASTFEVLAGIRKTFRVADGTLRPYVSLGGSLLNVDAEVGGADDDDTTFGIYVRLGMLFMITDKIGLGLEYRKMFADDLDLFGTDTDAGFDQISLVLGLGF